MMILKQVVCIYSVLTVVCQSMDPLIKFLSEPGIKVKMQKAENYYLQDQQRNMHIVDEELLFHIDEKNNSVDLTDKGLNMITKSGEDPEFFILPDIGVKLAEVEKNEAPA